MTTLAELAKIKPFNYFSGREFVDELKRFFDLKRDADIADLLGVPKVTVASWITRNACPHEIATRCAIHEELDLNEMLINGRFIRLNTIKIKDFESKDTCKFDRFFYNIDKDDTFIRRKDSDDNDTMYVFSSDFNQNLSDGEYIIRVNSNLVYARLKTIPAYKTKKIRVEYNDDAFELNKADIDAVGKIKYKIVQCL